MHFFSARSFPALAILAALPLHAQAPADAAFVPPPPAPITLAVDLRDAPQRILHATETLPVQQAGPLTLVYPKWIPGEHSPSGPIADMAGFLITANGQPVKWQRDPIDMFAFHVDVPAGAKQLEMKMDFLATAAAEGFSSGASTSASLALLSWNELVVYPDHTGASEVQVTPSITIPLDWHFGTALEADGLGSGSGTGVEGHPDLGRRLSWAKQTFKTVSLETLIDSPVLAGRWFKEIPLAPNVSPKHFLDMAADGPEDLELSPEHLNAFSKLVEETGALYKSRHYDSYHFLVTLSDQVAHFGLEHHQSSDDRVPEQTFTDDNRFIANGDLLPHEFTHSWNGKYRRPAGLATPNYQVPMVGDLLWVYEGLTEYLGDVLACRSGIWSPELFRGYLADLAADMDHTPGRTWRDLQDTARTAQVLSFAGGGWDNWRRGLDYYPEGELIWLDVDTTLREKSHGKKSLNDFVAAFHGLGGNTPPKVVPYTFEDVVAGLNAIVPSDWATFLHDRLDNNREHAPLDGLTHGGYELLYGENPNSFARNTEEIRETTDFWYSLGFHVSKSGNIADVLKNSVSDKAGIGPDQTILAVNGRAFTPNLLRQAIRTAKDKGPAIDLITQNTGYYRVVRLDYHDGERYPYLERTSGADRLDDIIKPMTK